MKKRVLSFVMAMLMVFSLMPVSVFATETGAPAVCTANGCIVTGEHTEHQYATTVKTTNPDTPKADAPAVTEGSKPVAPEGGDSTAPEGGDSIVPEGGDTTVPEGSDTTAPEGGDSTAPEGSDSTAPEGSDSTAPEGSGSTVPEGSGSIVPEGGDSIVPEGGDTTAPEGGDTTAPEGGDTDAAEAEKKICSEDCILAEGHEGECAPCTTEGCLFAGDPEHKGEECFVWEACTLTEGCELAAGHPGECTGAALFDNASVPVHFFLGSPDNIVNPNGQYTNYYIGTASDSIDNIKSNQYFNTLFTAQGIRNNSNEDFVVSFVKTWPEGKTRAQFETFSSVTIGGQRYSGAEYEIKWVTVCYRDPDSNSSSTRCNCRVDYEHVHVDGLMVKKVVPGEMEIYKSIPENAEADTTFTFKLEKLAQASITSAPQNAVDSSFAPQTLTATIPAGQSKALITGGSDITFGYYRLTENSASGWENNGIAFDPTSGSNTTSASKTLYVYIAPNGTVQYCDTLNGTYRTMEEVTILNKRAPLSVTYEWRLYDESGNYVAMPAGITPPLPAAETDIQYRSEYVYNTTYYNGESFIDPATGKKYTFHGWDTYSHSSAFNVVPATGYVALDDDDQITSNNKTVPMTADTYIYGYWSVSQLPPASAHIAVEKVFMLDGNDVTANLANSPIASAAGLWFLVDTGIDEDGDGVSEFDIEYSAILAQNGEYKLPVYQYDTAYRFTEQNADVPGYTRQTKIEVTGSNASLIKAEGGYAEVDLTQVYEGENVHLGTVTYINSYTRNVGTAVEEYPKLELGKLGTDNGNQAGAVFTLYSDAACTTAVNTFTIPESGMVEIDFTGMAAADYYLKETVAPAGYELDPSVYTVRLTAEAPVEELRNNQYVQVTYYGLEIIKPEESIALLVSAQAEKVYSLTVYDHPILGQVTFTKSAVIDGQPADLAADLPNLNANVVIHGPITRDSSGAVTDLGKTYDLYLTADNSWTETQINLPLGEYMVREASASVHGYSWDAVEYKNTTKTEIYNDVVHAIFHIVEDTSSDTAVPVSIELANTYAEWTAADFDIYKVDETDRAIFLSGAEFTVYTDEACKNEAVGTFTTKAVTGPAGWAHFGGFTVPAGQTEMVYYLKETAAPAGYYLDETIYKVEIKAVTDQTTNKVTYEPKITKLDGSAAEFDNTIDKLTVTNAPVLGRITITKIFDTDKPNGLVSVDVDITGHGYEQTVSLNAANNWTAVVDGLALGTYTVTELNANVPGYTLKTTYKVDEEATQEVELRESTVGSTPATVVVEGAIKITNSYTANNEYYEVPTALNILKVDENSQPLAGAVFTLTRVSDGHHMTFTTGADGKAKFDMLTGTMENNKPANGFGATKYLLKETTAPAGYAKSQEEWTIVVQEDNGEVRVVLNEDKNIFENFWDWILNQDSNYIWSNDGVLTVKNTKVLGELTVSKLQAGEAGGFKEEITVNVSGPNGYSKAVKLNAGNNWTETLSGLELGEYAVNEATVPMNEGYTYHVSMKDTDGAKISGSDTDGEVLLEINEQSSNVVRAAVEITNTYEKVTGDDIHVYPDFKVYKTDDQRNPLAGASFRLAGAELAENLVLRSDANGMVTFEDLEPGTYTLTELSAPAGYAKDDSVYQVVVSVKNGYPVEQLVGGKHVMHYEYAVAVTKAGAAVTAPNNTLTVVNHKVIGELTISKRFDANTATKPAAVYVNVAYPDGTNKEYTLNDVNNWAVKLTGLALGNYVVTEKDASISGYTLSTSMKDTDGNVTYGSANDGRVALAVGDLEAGFTAAEVSSSVEITNNYVKNTVKEAEILPDLTLYKLRTGTTNVMLKDAQFKLTGPNGYSDTVSTDAKGKLVVEGLKPGTYTLTETVAPAGYGLTENTYTIVVGQVSDSGDVLQADGTWLRTYTYDITSITDTNPAVEVRFVEETNTLAVFNSVDEGSITITKDFGVNSKLKAADFPNSAFTFLIQKADGSAAVDMDGNPIAPVTLSADTKWTVTVDHLPLGDYVVTEIIEDNADHRITSTGLYLYDTNKDGVIDSEDTAYKWTYASDPNGGKVSITSDDAYDTVAITNTFSEIDPAGFDVVKVDADTNKPLEGARFALYRKGETNALVTHTTTADGIASFSGFLNDGEYILKEVQAPENYELAAKNEWEVVVDRYNVTATQEAVKITIDGADKTNAELEVENSRTLGKLVINKIVSYGSLTQAQIDELPAAYRPDSYTFKVTILDGSNAYWNGYNAKEVSVPANGSLEITDVPYGYSYSVQEVTTGAVFTSVVTNGGGTIGAKNEVSATNTYTIVTETPGLNIVKHESDTPQVIAGAEFALYDGTALVDTAVSDADGRLNLELSAANKTYTLKETKPADGYHANKDTYTIKTAYDYEVSIVNGKPVIKQIVVVDAASFGSYETMKLTNPNADPADYEFHVINTKIKPVVISAEKIWSDDNYYDRPAFVEVQLMRDGVVFDSVKLNASNNWHHVWNGGIAAGLTDAYKWTVEEVAVDGYTASYVEDNGHWVFTNTRNPGAIELTVEKKWVDNNNTSYKPDSIKVQLLRDGVAYGPVTELTKTNDWKHTWTTYQDANINDAHKWTVEEIVPDGYEASYGNAVTTTGTLTITNTRIIRDLELTVNKKWENIPDGYEIPTTLEVVLMKDGVEIQGENKTLDAANKWTASWTELSNGTKLTDNHTWTVSEVIDDTKYTATYSDPVYKTREDNGATVVEKAITITNTLNWKPVDVTATKKWIAPDGYTDHPDSVEVQLYRNGEAYGAPVELSEANNWTHKWPNLEDCFVWDIEEVKVPDGYTGKVVTADHVNFVVENTLDFDFTRLTVSKTWLNPKGYTAQPTSVTVVLYRDGVAYETVTLSKANNWSYKWSALEDCFEWTVDEPNVPDKYAKKVTHIGTAWVITNAHKDIPLTGDETNILLWAGVGGGSVIGLGATMLLLLKKRREEDDRG